MFDRRFFDVNLIVLGVANEPAANPTIGTQYIVGDNPTGAFEDVTSGFIARYDGSAWHFITPKAGSLEVLNVATGEILGYNGLEWVVKTTVASSGAIKPVLDVVTTGTTLPATAAEGEKFLRTDNAKIYTATAVNTWDSGVDTADGDRYASSTDFKIYESNGSAVEGTDIPNGGMFLNKADGYVYVRDNNSLVKASEDISVSNEVTETHVLTSTDVDNKSFTLANSVASGKETSVLLSVCGVVQVAGTDYTASGNTISWNDKELDNIGLRAGDTFVIHYTKA